MGESGRQSGAEVSSYRARWVVADRSRSMDGGVLTVAGGTIRSLSKRAEGAVVELGDVLVIPGPINAHVHLDLSSVPARIPAKDGMAAWLESVVRHRRDGNASAEESIAAGLSQSVASGTAVHGDITSLHEESLEPWRRAKFAGVVYREVIGLKPGRYDPLWKSASVGGADGLDGGISPHAPYSTSVEVYRRCWSLPRPMPLATHWLESEEEVEFLESGGGALRAFLERIGAWPGAWECPADPWEAYLSGGRWNLVHCNFLRESDFARLAESRWRERVAAVTYCPRTHDWFEHPAHPWKRLLGAGVAVALGTDSLASNPDLSVLNEARWLAERHPDVAAATLFQMLTEFGAKALGLEGRYGSLAAGKSATFAVFQPREGRQGDLFSQILDPSTELIGLMVDGAWRVRGGSLEEM